MQALVLFRHRGKRVGLVREVFGLGPDDVKLAAHGISLRAVES
jgi:hypothetical protein